MPAIKTSKKAKGRPHNSPAKRKSLKDLCTLVHLDHAEDELLERVVVGVALDYYGINRYSGCQLLAGGR